MAVLWQHTEGTTHYEVRSAGASRRLYTDGVFHSQFNPRRPVSGGLWDLLLLPAFFRPLGSIRRVLVLGVGGGAVIRQVQHFLQPDQIIGVELDPVHLRVARRFFGVGGKSVQLIRADAHEWVRAYDEEPFDYIVDDLFSAAEGEPVRAVAANATWFRDLARVLDPDGVLTMNFPSAYALRTCGYVRSRSVRRGFAGAFRLTSPLYENVIATFLRCPATRRELHRNLAATPDLDTRKKSCRLRFTVRRMD
jgi:spermidine synthase